MQVTVQKREAITVVEVKGRIDTVSAPEFETKMEELFNQGEKGLILDFGKLEYVSSAGLRSILIAAKKAKSIGGDLCCCDLQDMVKKVFQISGFINIISVFNSVEDAMKNTRSA